MSRLPSFPSSQSLARAPTTSARCLLLEERRAGYNENGLTQLDNVANNTHDQETHPYGLRDAQEFALVGCLKREHMSANSILSHTLSMSREVKGCLRRTLAAPSDELAAVLDELARHLEEFLGLVHCCWYMWCVCCVCLCGVRAYIW